LPYKLIPARGDPNHPVYRPVVDLGMFGPGGSHASLALVDTGADDTLFPSFMARALGVILSTEDSGLIGAIGGLQLPVRYGIVNLELRDSTETFRWAARVAFHEYPGENRCLLGHEGFFNVFHVSFDNHRRLMTLRPHPHSPVEDS
jgi:hypothetical protein